MIAQQQNGSHSTLGRAGAELARLKDSGFLHVLSSHGAMKGIAAIQGLVLARILGADDLGRFAVFSSALALGAIVAQAGVPSALSRYVALLSDSAEQARLRDKAGTIAVLWSFGIGLLIALPWTGRLLSGETWVRSALPLAMLILPLQTASQSSLSLLHGRASFPKKSVLEASGSLVSLFLVGGSALILGLDGAAVGKVLAAVVIAGFICWSTGVRLPHASGFPAGFGKFAVLSLASASFSTMIHTADTLVLGAYRIPNITIGSYRVSVMVYSLLAMVPAAAMHTAFPRLVRADAGDENFGRLYSRIASRLLMYGLVAGATGLLILPELIAPIFGKQYSGAEPFVRILSAGLPLRALVLCAGSAILARGRPGLNLSLLVISGALNIFLNLFLVKAIGAVGAAWATLATEAISAAMGTLAVVVLLRRGSYES